MHISKRINLLRRLAQTAPASGTTGTTGTTTTQPVAVQTIDVRQLPGFKPQIFAARPDIIEDINKITNILNAGMTTLSGGKVNFNITWQDPSVTGSEYSNTVKNLLTISKWLYNVMKANTQQYSIDGLRAIGVSLIQTARGYSFPDAQATNIQSQLVSAGQLLLAKLGNGQV